MEKNNSARVLNRAFIFCVDFVSSFFRALGWRACRFHPTCSVYSKEAFSTLDCAPALWLTIKRFLKCHPFSAGGVDPLRQK